MRPFGNEADPSKCVAPWLAMERVMAESMRLSLDAEDLRAIMAGEPAASVGSFTHREVGDDGIMRTWSVSLAVGLGWLFKAREYASQFGKPPSWISRYHPFTRTRMLSLAMEKGRPLPGRSPLQV